MSVKPPSREVLFHYPFEGRPKPLARLGLFVFSPEVYLKLSGISLHGAFAEMGFERQYRRLQRFLNGETKLATGLKAIADIFEQRAPDNFVDIKNALAGDEAAASRVENLTGFESLFLGMQLSPEAYEPRHWFLILLEQVGTAALRQVQAGDIPGAARRIAEHPLLHHLGWPEALAAFERTPNERALGPILASMTLEAHLAWLAAWDHSLAQLAASESSSFTCLIPSDEQPGRNPTSLFYAELQRKLGAKSIGGVLATLSGSKSGVEQWTLNRWSAGTHFPDFESLSKLLQAYGLDRPTEILWSQFTCSKHLHLLGYLGQLFSSHASQAKRDKGQTLWPWPLYPFGYPSFEAWAGARYPHWRAVWADQSKDLPALASARPFS